MARLYPELAEREISIAVASCQSAEDIHQWITQQKSEFPFVFLADEKREMAKAYGVYKRIGWDSVNIAKPATLFLDSTGTLRFIDVWNSQFHVPTQDALMRIIHEVVGK